MHILRVLTLLGLVVMARAQGADDCGAPTLVSGLGPHAFDNSAATTSAQSAQCVTIGRDVWFRWVAPQSSTYTISTCGQTVIDSAIAVFDGTGCPASTAIACWDDTCGLQTSVAFATTAGASYVFQIGSFGLTNGGTGTFTISNAPAPCTGTSGPDVIIGDIQGIANYTAAGGIGAISLGIMGCNLGDTWVNWFASTNQHPVIAGSLYRYRVLAGSGRFEQIGQSWLKHGFFALSQTLCCPNCSPTDGTHLGVGCADPYTAARNGTQSALGPRREVNAATGVFAYPPANPAFSGQTARRLQFALADVDTSAGVRYFGEMHIVTADDAAAGNDDNNASHRELTTNGTSFALTGVAQRERSGLEAWLQCETGVSLVNVDVPGDGRFQVAGKATSLGGGQWHYEYAVHNLNSHRSGGTFSIPVGAATITNVEFHDVDYRNGDGLGNVSYSGLDWSAVSAGGVLTWSTESEAQNGNANALRWGTTYNFRFDADAAPIDSGASLGLWRTGSPSAIHAAVQVPDGGPSIVAYCFGDGSGAACPCGNSGAAGNGCASSMNPNGANLSAAGAPSIAADTLVLQGSGMPNTSALYFQGTTQIATTFGDGLRCAGGVIARLGTQDNASGASSYPASGDPAISVRGTCSVGDVRNYQCWYRNAAPFCLPNTFNLTNGLRVTWAP